MSVHTIQLFRDGAPPLVEMRCSCGWAWGGFTTEQIATAVHAEHAQQKADVALLSSAKVIPASDLWTFCNPTEEDEDQVEEEW